MHASKLGLRLLTGWVQGVFPLECVSKTNGIRASRWTGTSIAHDGTRADSFWPCSAVVLSLPQAEKQFNQRQQLLRNWGAQS